MATELLKLRDRVEPGIGIDKAVNLSRNESGTPVVS
jgi:hypothetical protein